MPTATKRPIKSTPPSAPPEEEPTDEEEEEPLIRVAFNAADLKRLLENMGDWDDPIAHRLRMRFSKHRMRWHH